MPVKCPLKSAPTWIGLQREIQVYTSILSPCKVPQLPFDPASEVHLIQLPVMLWHMKLHCS